MSKSLVAATNRDEIKSTRQTIRDAMAISDVTIEMSVV
jgi:hypothetical protein